jgi:3-oxoacyl-[acyl-carrier protein] reductase
VSENEQKVVVITGASSGIGAALARELTRRGHALVLSARGEEKLRELADEIGGRTHVVRADVTRRADVENVRDEALRAFGRVDVWINNAGRGISRPVLELTDEDLDEMMAVNVKGPLFGIQAATPVMKAAGGGSIINITSIAARSCYPKRGPYSISKAALENLTLQAAVELAPFKIRVNSISPGWFRTAMNEAHYQLPGELARRHATIPLGRIGAVEDVARLALFLATDESDYITGESIEIDGGLLAAALRSSGDLARLRPVPDSK